MITLGSASCDFSFIRYEYFGYFAGLIFLELLLQKLGIGTVKTVEKTMDVSMDGVKLGADVTTGAVRDATRMILPKTDAKKDKGTISESRTKKMMK